MASVEFVWKGREVPESHHYLMPSVLAALRDFESRMVLDLGCGNGAGTARLDREGFATSGCDASGSGLALARETHPHLSFFLHDIATPLPAGHVHHYDAVVSLEVIEHLMQPRQLALRAREALRPGGLFILSTPYHGYWKNLALALCNAFDAHWHPLRDFGHVKFFSPATLHPLLQESGFSILESRRLGRIPALARSLLVVAVKAKTL